MASKKYHVCKCQDSNGIRCGKSVIHGQWKQDGMCSACADNVWKEVRMSETSNEQYEWYHE